MDTEHDKFKYYYWLYYMGMNETLNIFDAPSRFSVAMTLSTEMMIDNWNKLLNAPKQ